MTLAVYGATMTTDPGQINLSCGAAPYGKTWMWIDDSHGSLEAILKQRAYKERLQ